MTSPKEIHEFRSAVWTDVRDRYEDEYKDLSDIWSKLDTKAQGAATIAGVFLAAVFAVARGDSVPVQTLDKALLAGAILALVGSVIAAGISLHVRVTHGGPTGANFERAAIDMEGHTATYPDLDELRIRFVRTQVSAWSRCNEGFRDANSAKAATLRIAQNLVLAGASLALLVTLHTLLESR